MKEECDTTVYLGKRPEEHNTHKRHQKNRNDTKQLTETRRDKTRNDKRISTETREQYRNNTNGITDRQKELRTEREKTKRLTEK